MIHISGTEKLFKQDIQFMDAPNLEDHPTHALTYSFQDGLLLRNSILRPQIKGS